MKITNNVLTDFYQQSKFENISITDIPDIIKDKCNIFSFVLCRGYSHILIGTEKLIDYIMENLDNLREFNDKIYFELEEFGAIIFDSIEVCWNINLTKGVDYNAKR